MDSRDLALLISMVGLHDDKTIKGRTRIQKLACILKYRERLPLGFEFKPYFYGPYSTDLADSVNVLVGMKILRETIVPIDMDKFRYEYELTEHGRRLFDLIQKKLSAENPKVVSTLSRAVANLEPIPTSDLVYLAKASSRMPSVLP